MKKRFFAIYALISAFIASPIFTSCVEDEESASVTAIRNSKTEELKSIAALKKAEAQAEATLTAANTALKAAEAEAQVAAAKLTEAKTALQNTQNEAEAARLLVAQKQAEADLARIQGEIEEQEIAIQVALLNAQRDLVNIKQQLEQQTKSYKDAEKAELMRLANKYSNAVQELLNAKKTLISMESSLAWYETGLADAKESLEINVAYYNQRIVQYQIYIDTYKQYANYTEDMDALNKKLTEAQVAYNLASDKNNAAWINHYNADDEVDTEALQELKQAIENDAFYKFTVERHYYDAETEEYKHFNSFGINFSVAIERGDNFIWVLNSNYQVGTYKYEYECGENVETYWYGDTISYEFEYGKDIRKAELDFGQYIDPIKANIKAAEEAIDADETALTAAVAATAAAKTAWDNAAEADKDTKKAEYEAALNAELGLKSSIENNEQNIENWNKELAVWTNALDMLKNAETLEAALQEKIKAHNDAVKAAYEPVIEAWKAAIDTQIVFTEAAAELQAIETLLNDNYPNGVYNPSANALAQYIENYELWIEYYEEQIAEAEKLLANNDFSYEDMIAWQKAQIEAQKAVVAAKEIAVNDAKAALDAAMPADEEASEE